MTEKRQRIHAFFVLLAPLLVAIFEWSLLTAVALLLWLLLWRWLIVMSGLTVPEKAPELQLETIAASHFAEKVRWCMDHLGIAYTENKSAGTLGVFYAGRTVPQLKMRTGAVRSSIGNSTEILRYLYGRYSGEAGIDADFLKPTPERVELERGIDRLGVKMQIWVYHHLLQDRELTLQAWGLQDPETPSWQKPLIRLLFPIQKQLIRRAFRINDESFARAVSRIEAFLGEMNERLADGANSLSGESQPNYADFAFAAMNGLWLMPENYGGCRADAVRIAVADMPERMRLDVESWRAAYPNVVAFIEALYQNKRVSP